MTQEYKELLLKDLCARLPYGVKIFISGGEFDALQQPYLLTAISKFGMESRCKVYHPVYTPFECPEIQDIKPYLRSMSSMTDEEKEEFESLWDEGFGEALDAQLNGQNDLEVKTLEITASYKSIQWLLKNHFDFMGLIPKGLAIKVTESNNIYKD